MQTQRIGGCAFEAQARETDGVLELTAPQGLAPALMQALQEAMRTGAALDVEALDAQGRPDIVRERRTVLSAGETEAGAIVRLQAPPCAQDEREARLSALEQTVSALRTELRAALARLLPDRTADAQTADEQGEE